MAEQLVLTTEEKAPLSVNPMTAAGNPAPIDGAVTYAVTSGTCTIEPIDTLTAFVVSGPAPGDSTVTATADADLGSGIVTITDVISVHVTSPTAEQLGLSAGTPVLK
jgi:hypothetical protein